MCKIEDWRQKRRPRHLWHWSVETLRTSCTLCDVLVVHSVCSQREGWGTQIRPALLSPKHRPSGRSLHWIFSGGLIPPWAVFWLRVVFSSPWMIMDTSISSPPRYTGNNSQIPLRFALGDLSSCYLPLLFWTTVFPSCRASDQATTSYSELEGNKMITNKRRQSE